MVLKLQEHCFPTPLIVKVLDDSPNGWVFLLKDVTGVGQNSYLVSLELSGEWSPPLKGLDHVLCPAAGYNTP